MRNAAEVLRGLFGEIRIKTKSIWYNSNAVFLDQFKMNVLWESIKEYTTADIYQKDGVCDFTPEMYTVNFCEKPQTAYLVTAYGPTPDLAVGTYKLYHDSIANMHIIVVPTDPPKLLEIGGNMCSEVSEQYMELARKVAGAAGRQKVDSFGSVDTNPVKSEYESIVANSDIGARIEEIEEIKAIRRQRIANMALAAGAGAALGMYMDRKKEE